MKSVKWTCQTSPNISASNYILYGISLQKYENVMRKP